MAGSLNKVMLIGHLGRDPEVRTFAKGGKVANFSLATSESWKDRQTGERHERTEWHNVAIFSDGLIGLVERYLRKGSRVYVEGQLQTRKWQDQNGNDRYSTEVVLRGLGGTLTFLDSAQQGGSRTGGQHGGGYRGQTGAANHGGAAASNEQRLGGGHSTDTGGRQWGGGGYDDLDDDIPF